LREVGDTPVRLCRFFTSGFAAVVDGEIPLIGGVADNSES